MKIIQNMHRENMFITLCSFFKWILVKTFQLTLLARHWSDPVCFTTKRGSFGHRLRRSGVPAWRALNAVRRANFPVRSQGRLRTRLRRAERAGQEGQEGSVGRGDGSRSENAKERIQFVNEPLQTFWWLLRMKSKTSRLWYLTIWSEKEIEENKCAKVTT